MTFVNSNNKCFHVASNFAAISFLEGFVRNSKNSFMVVVA